MSSFAKRYGHTLFTLFSLIALLTGLSIESPFFVICLLPFLSFLVAKNHKLEKLAHLKYTLALRSTSLLCFAFAAVLLSFRISAENYILLSCATLIWISSELVLFSEKLQGHLSLAKSAVEKFKPHKPKALASKSGDHLYIFFRGQWCPQCRQQITEFYKHVETFKNLGLPVTWLSLQPEESFAMLKNDFPEFEFESVKEEAASAIDGLIDIDSTPVLFSSLKRNNFRPHAVILDSGDNILAQYDSEATAIRVLPGELLENYRQICFERQLKRQVSEKTQTVRNLLRLVVHDLANPLTVAKASTELLQKRLKTEDRKTEKLMDRLTESIQIQGDIISSVREIEAVGSGKMKLQLQNVDIDATLEQQRQRFSELLENKNIQLITKLGANGECCNLDPSIFKHQVLANLMTNAIKFTPERGVIELSSSISNNSLELTFRDNGIGMPNEILKDLFKMDASTNRKGLSGEKGTGFGMPIVFEFVQALNGEIAVATKEKGKQVEYLFEEILSPSSIQHCADWFANHDSGTIFLLRFKLRTLQEKGAA